MLCIAPGCTEGHRICKNAIHPKNTSDPNTVQICGKFIKDNCFKCPTNLGVNLLCPEGFHMGPTALQEIIQTQRLPTWNLLPSSQWINPEDDSFESKPFEDLFDALSKKTTFDCQEQLIASLKRAKDHKNKKRYTQFFTFLSWLDDLCRMCLKDSMSAKLEDIVSKSSWTDLHQLLIQEYTVIFLSTKDIDAYLINSFKSMKQGYTGKITQMDEEKVRLQSNWGSLPNNCILKMCYIMAKSEDLVFIWSNTVNGEFDPSEFEKRFREETLVRAKVLAEWRFFEQTHMHDAVLAYFHDNKQQKKVQDAVGVYQVINDDTELSDIYGILMTEFEDEIEKQIKMSFEAYRIWIKAVNSVKSIHLSPNKQCTESKTKASSKESLSPNKQCTESKTKVSFNISPSKTSINAQAEEEAIMNLQANLIHFLSQQNRIKKICEMVGVVLNSNNMQLSLNEDGDWVCLSQWISKLLDFQMYFPDQYKGYLNHNRWLVPTLFYLNRNGNDLPHFHQFWKTQIKFVYVDIQYSHALTNYVFQMLQDS